MTVSSKSTNKLVVQGSILAIASLIVRLIGFFYRIPLVNMIGEEGMAYYSAAFSIYSFTLVISTYAFPAALSKIISKKIALKKYKEAHEIFKAALLLAAIVGLVTSLLMYFQAENLANLIKSPGSMMSFKALAPALLIFSFLAVFRGYFQGLNTMVPTGVSQIVEQIFNALTSLIFAYVLLKQSLEAGAAGGNLGATFGALAGLIFMIFLYVLASPRFRKQRIRDKYSDIKEEALFDYWQVIMMTVVPMMLGTSAFHLANLSDTLFFMRGLQFNGATAEFAASQFGILTSKYSLLIMLPISLATALGTASIPSISESLAKKEFLAIKNKVRMAIRIVLMIAIPAACGLGFLAEPIIIMLFPESSNISEAAFLMQIGAISVVTYSVSSISTAVLQGLNKIKIPVRNALIAVGVRIILIFILLYAFNLGLVGAVINSVIFSFIIVILNYRSLQKEIHLKLNYKQIFAIPAVAGIIMGISSVLVHMIMIAISGSNTIATIIAIVFAVAIYFIAMLALGGITEEVLRSIPMGSKLARLAKRFHWI